MPGQTLPASVLRAQRTELTDVPLRVKRGTLPAGLHGHLFFMSLAGHIESGGLPYPDGTHMLNSDGMIHRLSLGASAVRTTTRLAATPCYYADITSRSDRRYERLRFDNFDLVRMSPELGFRNLLNTAFMVMPSDAGVPRLFGTYDAGRPSELDTQTLSVVTPVGSYKEWSAEALKEYPFPPVLASAHPVFDPYTHEMFCVNYGRSTLNLARGIPAVEDSLEVLFAPLASVIELVAAMGVRLTWHLFPHLREALRALSRLVTTRLARHTLPSNFTHLIRWNGSGPLESFRLVHPNGTPVVIKMTMHQVGLTRDYLVLADTAFKMSVDQVYNKLFTRFPGLDRVIHQLTTEPNEPNLKLYLLRRTDLERARSRSSETIPDVRVKALTLPLEAIHFLTDYENSDGMLTLHISHTSASDIAEQVRPYDIEHVNKRAVNPNILGMFVNAMDVNRLGRWVIDPVRLRVVDSKVVTSDELTWGLSFATSPDFVTNRHPLTHQENVYWSVVGVFPELYTEFIYQLYKDYPNRMVPLQEIDRLSGLEGRRSCLIRVNARTQQIADRYLCEEGSMLSSPQFVPLAGADPNTQRGYLVCTLFTPDGAEILIFDTEALHAGPLCHLDYPMAFAFSIHSAWLPRIGPRTASYLVSVQEDIGPRVHSPLARELFDEAVYPHFE